MNQKIYLRTVFILLFYLLHALQLSVSVGLASTLDVYQVISIRLHGPRNEYLRLWIRCFSN